MPQITRQIGTLEDILSKVFGIQAFRPKQKEIIEALLKGEDVLALLPTGGGKSLCYQLPALAMPGVCLVVSPLVALMKDQVEALKKKNVLAEALYSGLSYREVDRILDNCVHGNVKMLYVAPERLKSELFLERFKQMNVNLIAVDEAHCISDWGYDFRPAYLNIHLIRNIKPKVPCIALTATATPKVQEDIQSKLRFKHARIFRTSFLRKNIALSCIKTELKQKAILERIKLIDGQGIVYVRTRKAAKEMAVYLVRNQISATIYHAGLNQVERQKANDQWQKGEAKVIVATNAFGMGIDKSDVRFVYHYDLPESLEAYYQEAGRAGRDGLPAEAILFYFEGDIHAAREKIQISFPSIEYLRSTYQHLANYYRLAIGSAELESFDFDFDDFRTRFKLEVVSSYNALKKLEDEGYIHLNESFYAPSKAFFLIPYDKLYEFQLKFPRLDLYIKALLRIYGGDMFLHYTTISESKLASYLKVTEAELVKNLELLEKQNVIDYEPSNSKSKITFITPRLDAVYLSFNQKKMQEQKARKVEKQEEVIHYLLSSTMCRMRYILDYFGEDENSKCSKCDNCVNLG